MLCLCHQFFVLLILGSTNFGFVVRRYAAHPCQGNPSVTNGCVDWTALDSDELLAWFGVLMLMGLKKFPHIRCYWDHTPFYNCPLISKAMPHKRFEAIIGCLHLVNNEVVVTNRGDPTYDKLAKCCSLCESFASISQSLYNNEYILTVDEIMIPYKATSATFNNTWSPKQWSSASKSGH